MSRGKQRKPLAAVNGRARIKSLPRKSTFSRPQQSFWVVPLSAPDVRGRKSAWNVKKVMRKRAAIEPRSRIVSTGVPIPNYLKPTAAWKRRLCKSPAEQKALNCSKRKSNSRLHFVDSIAESEGNMHASPRVTESEPELLPLHLQSQSPQLHWSERTDSPLPLRMQSISMSPSAYVVSPYLKSRAHGLELQKSEGMMNYQNVHLDLIGSILRSRLTPRIQELLVETLGFHSEPVWPVCECQAIICKFQELLASAPKKFIELFVLDEAIKLLGQEAETDVTLPLSLSDATKESRRKLQKLKKHLRESTRWASLPQQKVESLLVDLNDGVLLLLEMYIVLQDATAAERDRMFGLCASCSV